MALRRSIDLTRVGCQAVIRRDPAIAGVEQPALRALPAWRPRSNRQGVGRGYIDLAGLDGNGNVRIVETKLATNADDLLSSRVSTIRRGRRCTGSAAATAWGNWRATFELHDALGADA